jgi:hypothetical protein
VQLFGDVYSREVFWYRFCNEFDTYQKSRIDLNEK